MPRSRDSVPTDRTDAAQATIQSVDEPFLDADGEFLAQVVILQDGLIARATGESFDETTYRRYRGQLLARHDLRHLVPPFVRKCRTLAQFWGWIKEEKPTYAERRSLIWGGVRSFDRPSGTRQSDAIRRGDHCDPRVSRRRWGKPDVADSLGPTRPRSRRRHHVSEEPFGSNVQTCPRRSGHPIRPARGSTQAVVIGKQATQACSQSAPRRGVSRNPGELSSGRRELGGRSKQARRRPRSRPSSRETAGETCRTRSQPIWKHGGVSRCDMGELETATALTFRPVLTR